MIKAPFVMICMLVVLCPCLLIAEDKPVRFSDIQPDLVAATSKLSSNKEFNRIEESFIYTDTPPVTWINIDGLHEIELIEKIGTHFNIHPLILEDIVNTGLRPKVEDFEDYIYLVFKMLKFDDNTNHIASEQISFVLGRDIRSLAIKAAEF